MKPSEIKSVRAKKAWMLLKSYRALTWKGTVYCNLKSDVKDINKSDEIDSILKCHETIHVRQAASTHDSWTLFYLLYIWQWLKNLPLVFIQTDLPYKFMEFELEAYGNERCFFYATAPVCTGWKEYKKLGFRKKWKLARFYKEIRREMTFWEFVNEYVNQELTNN